ncbi:FecCD family ABC transporter permease [Bordetella genomosp. 11]|uniref:Iron-siderophore ABC transporter permease n=1 Tax=Bordetella genomosp. 11 TaxID=1416808 RepID=A0A261UKR0_9BORD|nr:iron ABC transporter permease [Bordetella genomosp. 11]OZI62221.1 iron-siderophore ABC transporter permease [Bordetella genomosp. 11]
MAGVAAPDPVRRYRGILRRRQLLLFVLAALIGSAMLADFLTGSSPLPIPALLDALLHPGEAAPVERVIVWSIRLPYALAAALVGMALGLAGAEMQTVLNNPLASPDTLGVSSAAALGASVAIVFGAWLAPGIAPDWSIAAFAFAFAAAAALLLDAMARWSGMRASGVVLFGIALVFLCNALVSAIQFVASAQALQNLVFWTMGSLGRIGWPQVGALALALAVAMPFSLRAAWRLTALRLGAERAASFGVDVRRLRLGALARVSLLSAVAVSLAGVIGFIGLVAPHIARRLFGEDHRFYLAGSALVGAIVLSLASILSKSLVPGLVLPIGIVTALAGLPVFLAVVLRRQLP